ncbi:hypothetical protein [Limimaricola cinnabarinus]|uniref:Phage protein n=1 Tax=Limimaricola cinnabarinus LL-001 TaxID=1337093 RepID=U2YKK1_9RHOB|nr:hypothetical protein [Limimaricola cinnabarinus]GAD55506.1 hypothetical protein MBELCI_1558 [Limimaricola cinnabarinus LL-001]
MALQASTAVRNAMLDAIEATVGASPTLEIRSGVVPATTGTADSGTLLASMVLPADWLANAATGSKGLLGTWRDASADASGTAAHYRIKQGVTTHLQGTVTATGGGGDLTLDNTSIAVGQAVSITAYTLAQSGA